MIIESDHRSVLARLVDAHGPVKMGELYERYRAEVDEPVTRRAVRTKLQHLAEDDRIDAVGQKRGRYYRTTRCRR